MFDLEKALKDWKRALRKNKQYEDGDIEELESHLRDRVNELIKDRIPEKEAFSKALDEIGSPELIGDELFKTKAVNYHKTKLDEQGSFILQLLPNYLKTTFRTFKRNFTFSIINITGLAIGVACCILISMFISYEYSFDSFHSKKDRIYRVNKVVTEQTSSTEELHALTSGPMGLQMQLEFPEIEEVVRVRNWFSEVLVSHEEKHIQVKDFVFVDSTFFKVFDFKLISGNPNLALTKPLSIILSEEMSQIFFGSENPMGKTLTGLNGLDYTVTGVVENAPENSHLQYDILASWSSVDPGALDFSWMTSRWFPQSIYTYLVLQENTSPEVLESKFPEFMERNFPERAAVYQLFLQPFNEIYLYSSRLLWIEPFKSGNATNLTVFSLVAIFILLIACINFMNLSIAQATKRAKEVGVRKVLGANRGQLGIQFLGETLLYSIMAFVLSIGLVLISRPFLAFINLDAVFMSLADNLDVISLIFLCTVLAGLLSGIYPSAILSAFKPIVVLYNKSSNKTRGTSLRKVLVVTQFSLSICLIIGTFVINKQLNFAGNKDLGFNKDQVLVLQIGDTEISNQGEAFKNELLKNSSIVSVAGSNSHPGSTFMSYGIRPEGLEGSDNDWVSSVLLVDDFDLLDTYGFEIESGRYFESQLSTDSTQSIVINEALAQSLDWDNPIGKRLDIPGDIEEGIVIGVIKNFHTQSFHRAIDPLVIFFDQRWGELSVKISAQNTQETLAYINSKWAEFESKRPFEYEFIDQTFSKLYAEEQRTRNLLTAFSGLAILVSCFGLFGLSIFTANERIKEIGIRKVLGSSLSSIVLLLSKDFLKLVLIALLIAAPFSYYFAHSWLQEFVYRTEIGVWPFLFAGLIACSLAFFTIAWQSIKAALANPVHSLKSE
ncbi:MAG: ABC transporter permease [Balneolaceae bacterium]